RELRGSGRVRLSPHHVSGEQPVARRVIPHPVPIVPESLGQHRSHQAFVDEPALVLRPTVDPTADTEERCQDVVIDLVLDDTGAGLTATTLTCDEVIALGNVILIGG